MSGINKVILIGHVGKQPEFRYLENNVPVISFPLATSAMFNKGGVKTEQTEWHNIVMWRGIAEAGAKLLTKGILIFLEGKLHTRAFEDKTGIQKYTTEVIADSFILLGRTTDFEDEQHVRHTVPGHRIIDPI